MRLEEGRQVAAHDEAPDEPGLRGVEVDDIWAGAVDHVRERPELGQCRDARLSRRRPRVVGGAGGGDRGHEAVGLRRRHSNVPSASSLVGRQIEHAASDSGVRRLGDMEHGRNHVELTVWQRRTASASQSGV